MRATNTNAPNDLALDEDRYSTVHDQDVLIQETNILRDRSVLDPLGYFGGVAFLGTSGVGFFVAGPDGVDASIVMPLNGKRLSGSVNYGHRNEESIRLRL